MPNGSEQEGSGASRAAHTAGEAIKWGRRARWLGGCSGCGGCAYACGMIALIILGIILFLVILQVLCDEAFGGVLGWVDRALSSIGLGTGICSIFK